MIHQSLKTLKRLKEAYRLLTYVQALMLPLNSIKTTVINVLATKKSMAKFFN